MKKQRYQKLFRELPANSALILGSAPERIRTNDTNYPFRQDSNFYYLTGSQIKNVILCINDQKEKLLIGQKLTKHQLVWDGAGDSLSELAKVIDAKYIETDNQELEVRKFIHGKKSIFYQNSQASKVQTIINNIQKNLNSFTFSDANQILAKLRVYKDKEEIQLIQEAVDLNEDCFSIINEHLQPNIYEFDVADKLYALAKMQNACPSFNTIVASGKNAAVLHYENLSSIVKNNSFLLVDFGIEKNMYCSDLTRCFAIGNPTSVEIDVYEIVKESLVAAINKAKNKAKINDLYFAAVKVLVQGLIDLKVLKGSLEKNLEKKTYLEFFPHSIGHPIGLDVHDIGNFRGNNNAIIETNMVFAIETGLYFREKIGKIPSMGIRLEDNILIKDKKYQMLSSFSY